MGCTPSIHVSQTGVVYCRESDEATSPRPPSDTNTASQTATGIFTQTVSTSYGIGSSTSGNMTSSHRKMHKTSSAVVDQKGQGGSPRHGAGDSWDKGMAPLHVGSMRINRQPMSILLVFSKQDAQSDAFSRAAEQGGYPCDFAKTPADALQRYQTERHDVIVVDGRSSKYFDVESFCRNLREIKESQYTVVMAITKAPSSEKEASILPLLNAGANKRFLESPSRWVCLNELLTLDHGEVSSMARLRAAEALARALDQVNETVDITDGSHHLQYVNSAFERVFSFTASDVLGKDVREIGLYKTEKNKPELMDSMYSHLNKGKPWEGIFTSVKKSGEPISHLSQITPMENHRGNVRHFISTKTPLADTVGGPLSERFGLHMHKGHRRDSLVRMHAMTIEAPITQVINIINAAQESSTLNVSQSLDKVLEILRSSELYSPFLSSQVKDDQMTHDLVGGLMTTNVKRYSGCSDANLTKNAPPGSGPFNPSSILTHASPEVQALLKHEPDWNFNIIELERVTKKKPLVHLALKTFRRFGVMEFLQVSEPKMALWLQLIEENYHSSNSYHNSTHAADVLHATAYFLCRDKIKNLMDQMDEVACLLAAVVHDLDHPGRTNSFLVNSSNPLSLLYNDIAVLESHHVSLAFRLTTRDPRVNIFKKVDRDDFRQLREQIIDMVLATDMTKHFVHLNKFASNVGLAQNKEDEVPSTGKNSPDSTTSRSRLTTPENRRLIKRVLIKCADICNPLRPLELCKEWAYRISDEYFLQTDEEKEKNYPVIMGIFDRKTCNVPKSQVSFVDFFIKDMFDTWNSFCDTPELIKHMHENYNFWKQKEQSAEQEIKET